MSFANLRDIPQDVARRARFTSMSDAELIHLSKFNPDAKEYIEQRVIRYIQTLGSQGLLAAATALRPLFSAAITDQDQLSMLVQTAVFKGGYFPAAIAAVFEQMDWPDQKIKTQLIRRHLGAYIAEHAIVIKWWVLDPDRAGRGVIEIVPKNIFGLPPTQVFPSLRSALIEAVEIKERNILTIMHTSKQMGFLDPERPIKIRVVIHKDPLWP